MTAGAVDSSWIEQAATTFVTTSTPSAYSVHRYEPAFKAEWDALVRASKNGTFLFLRDYMEYHGDRFEDHSLLIRDKGVTVAMLPANSTGAELVSHGGLTYGGFIMCEGMTTPAMLEMF